jgi:hypothetical protein
MIRILIITLSLASSNAQAGCSGALRDVLMKLQNQVYHVGNGSLMKFKRLGFLVKGKPTEARWVNASELDQIHPINYPNQMMREKLAERINAVKDSEEVIVEHGFSLNLQDQVMHSWNPIRVVADRNGKLVVQDGNGRLEAVRRVFGQQDVRLQVVEIKTRDPEVLDLLDQIRAISRGEL